MTNIMVVRTKINFQPKLTEKKRKRMEEDLPFIYFDIEGNNLIYAKTFDWQDAEMILRELDALRELCYYHLKTRIKGKILAYQDSNNPTQILITFSKEQLNIQTSENNKFFHWVQVFRKIK